MVDISLPYFTARPASDGPVPGIVIAHEGNGMGPQLLRVAQRLAAQGYATVAPDLFFRAGGSEAGDFATLMGSLDRDRTQADLREAADLLRRQGSPVVGITGFCMGGMLTYRAAVGGGFDAAVGFYGAGISHELGTPACPTLLVFGGTDEYIPPSEIEAVVAHHPDTVVYPDAGHGFMRDGSPNFDEAAAADAWQRLLAFFGAHLGVNA
jgi:carboxymethylenebutenolidase